MSNSNSSDLLQRHTLAKQALDAQSAKVYEIKANLQSLMQEKARITKELCAILDMPLDTPVEELAKALADKKAKETAALEDFEKAVKTSSTQIAELSSKLNELTLF